MKTAIYPGSFDPVTLGHMDVIGRAAAFFDRVIVTVMANPGKTPAFTVEERISFLRRSIEAAGLSDQVETACFTGLLADYAKTAGACAIVKGLRAVSDFDVEFQMALMNRKLNPHADTVFFMADGKYLFISSSLVRDIARHGGDISGFVCPSIADEIGAKLKKA